MRKVYLSIAAVLVCSVSLIALAYSDDGTSTTTDQGPSDGPAGPAVSRAPANSEPSNNGAHGTPTTPTWIAGTTTVRPLPTTTAAAFTGTWFFGRVVSVDLGAEYESNLETAGPATFYFESGASVRIVAGTPFRGGCDLLPRPVQPTNAPCYLAGWSAEGVAHVIQVLHFGPFTEGEAPSLYASAPSVVAIQGDRVDLSSGLSLFLNPDSLALTCGPVTALEDILAVEESSFRFRLDPTNGSILEISCQRRF